MSDAHDVASIITHDFLGKELYVIFSMPLKSREELDEKVEKEIRNDKFGKGSFNLFLHYVFFKI